MSLPAPTKYLLEWFVRYIKNRDLIFRRISDIIEEGNKLIVKQKDGKTLHYYIEPFPDDFGNFSASATEEHCGIVVYNSAENFEKLTSAWSKLSSMPGLTLYFVNPFSKLDKRWVLRPHIHARISDAESLKQGLRSMYETVEPISKKEIEQLTK